MNFSPSVSKQKGPQEKNCVVPGREVFLILFQTALTVCSFHAFPFSDVAAAHMLVTACSWPNVRQVNVQPSKPGLCCDMDRDCKLVQYFPLHSCPPLPDMQKKHQGKVNSCSELFQAKHKLGLPAIQWEAAEEVRLPSTVFHWHINQVLLRKHIIHLTWIMFIRKLVLP